MFCSKCGKEIDDKTTFCPYCGNKVGESSSVNKPIEQKIMLDPSEVVPHKDVTDSSKSFSGQGKSFGLVLMIVSIIIDLLGMMTIGFDAFIPITIGATFLFVIGFLIMLFCP